MPLAEREQRSASLLGREKTEEHRRRIAEGQRRAWARRKGLPEEQAA